jgi:hypothetical protein
VEDLSGSEWEWTAGPADVAQAALGIIRGGSWRDSGMFLEISNRGVLGPKERYWGRGLRVCADAP